MRVARIALLAILVLPSAAPAETAVPRIVVQEHAYDAGTIDAGTVIRHTFALQNGGDADLHLEVQPGCACTVVQFDKTVAPGASGTITATLDTINYTGRITKEIRVKSDDPSNGSIGLRLQADVVPALTVTPSARVSLRGTAAELKPVELVLASSDGKPFDVLRVDADPLLAASATPDAAAVPARTRYVVTIAARPEAPPGRLGRVVTIVTSHPHAPPLILRVDLDVRPEVLVTPKRIVLHTAAPQAAQHVRIVKSSGALAVLGVDSTDASIVATATEVTAGHEYDLAIRYAGTPGQALARAEVTVHTDDPRQQVIRISVVARP